MREGKERPLESRMRETIVRVSSTRTVVESLSDASGFYCDLFEGLR